MAILQSGGFPRFLPIGPLLRETNPEVVRHRRALSQSLLYVKLDSGKLNKQIKNATSLCALDSISQIIQRSELTPPHPEIEMMLYDNFEEHFSNEHDGLQINNEVLISLIKGWAISLDVTKCKPPIHLFDDEGANGSECERLRWSEFQEFSNGQLSRWVNPQIRFSWLSKKFDLKDERRVDFVLTPPWSEPLVWEVHGEYSDIDKSKNHDLESNNINTFNDIVSKTTKNERTTTLQELANPQPNALISNSFNELMDSSWIVSQIDLALFTLLGRGTWSKDNPILTLQVPAKYKGIADKAAEKFIELVKSAEQIWNLSDKDVLISEDMKISDIGTNISISIDPSASSYLESNFKMKHDLYARRAYLPVDAQGLWQPWDSNKKLCEYRPASISRPQIFLPILQRCFNFDDFRAGQYRGLCAALNGTDALVLLPTGHGKSLIFQLAALILPGVTIVVEYLRALIEDQVRVLQNRGIGRVLAIHRDRQLDSVTGTDDLKSSLIIYLAPERLYVESFQKPIDTLLHDVGLDILVIDEAHVVSEAGHSFRPSYLGLVDRISELSKRAGCPKPPCIALTATAANIVIRDIKGILKIDAAPITLLEEGSGNSFVRTNLKDKIISFDAEEGVLGLEKALKNAIDDKKRNGKGIVFCVSKKKWFDSRRPAWFGVDGTLARFEGTGCVASVYKGGNDMSAEERATQTQNFIEGNSDVMVSTNAFGAGIDLPDIRWVMNIGLPAGIEAYYQQLGRAGRDGLEATGFLLVDNDSDEVINSLITSRSKKASFGSLRDVLSNSYDKGLGSIARQLVFLVGSKKFDESVTHDMTRTYKEWLPSFPGWEYEARSFDFPLLQSIFKHGSLKEVKLKFNKNFDSLVWKSINRARELGLISGSYSRTFANAGLNQFTLQTTDLVKASDLPKLVERLEDYLARLRGVRRAEDNSEKARVIMSKMDTPIERVLFATRTMLANTYEAVRESRLGSLDGLRTYCRTKSQGDRHQIIEDYFATDDFVKELIRICNERSNVENWKLALDAAKHEGHWRIGVFQRLLEDFPGDGLPNFLLLVGLLHGGRIVETKLPISSIFGSDNTPLVTQEWAWRVLNNELGESICIATHKAFAEFILSSSKHDSSCNIVYTKLIQWLSHKNGETELAHAVVAKWVEDSLKG